MVVIKDFGMPSCCENCNMCNNRNLDTFYCCITLNDVNIDEKAHDCPLVEVEERKVGKWILIDEESNIWQCTHCKELGKDDWWQLNSGTPEDNKMNCCPHCGAEMVGVENG